MRALLSWIAVLYLAACAPADSAAGAADLATEPPLPADPGGEADWRIDLGASELGRIASRQVLLRNEGQGTLSLAAIPVAAPFGVEPADAAALPPGATRSLEIRFQPLELGRFETLLPLRLGESTRWVRLVGEGIAPPSGVCRLQVDRQQVDFGKVGTRTSVTSTLRLRNLSEHLCAVELDLQGAPAFGTNRYLELAPGQELKLPVTFGPTEAGRATALLQIASEGDELLVVELAGEGLASCLAGPAALSFPQVGEGCWSESQRIDLHNRCDHPVRFTALQMQGDAQAFRISSRPNLPLELAAGATTALRLQLIPPRPGLPSATLLALEDAGDGVQVRLDGEASPRREIDQIELQGRRPDADRLYVVDDSPSMEAHRWALQQLAAGVQADLQAIDARLGITGTSRQATPECVGTGADGRLLPFDRTAPRILDRQELLDGRLGPRLQAVPTCSAAPNEAFAVAERAVVELADRVDDPAHPEAGDGNAGLRRPDVPLEIVFVLGRDDQSAGQLQTWVDRFTMLQRERALAFSAYLTAADCDWPAPGGRVERLVEQLGGTLRHLCFDQTAGPWAKDAPAWPYTTRYYLQDEPLDRNGDGEIDEAHDGFVLYVSGDYVPQRMPDGSLRYRVNPATRSVDFTPGLAPPEGAIFEFLYVPICR